MHSHIKLTLIISCHVLFTTIYAYKPLVIMHGILTGRKSMVSMAEHIRELLTITGYSTVRCGVEVASQIGAVKRRCIFQFNSSWECDYSFTESEGGAKCLVCGNILGIKKYNLERHYRTHHFNQYGSVEGEMLLNLLNNLCEEGSKVEAHPGTKITIINKYAAWESLAPMWHQVVDVGREIMKISAAHPDGINLIGYSQGGLIARAILQQFPNHNVKTFISLSSPQAGQYGTQFLHLFFPNLVRETAYELFYSSLGQHTSVGNYWNDPYHKELYYNYSKFLPYVNNELESPYSSQYKYGLTKLDNLVLIGGPDDGVITPWESSHFGYYDENGTLIDMREQPAYVNDTLGLQTLDLKGKLLLIKVHGVSHLQWHKNATVIDKFLLPFLD